jgi:hypothetical protein
LIAKPSIVDPADGLPVLDVGPWTAEKHDYLRRYIVATKAARARFLPPVGSGGAAFIDLFAGPGRAQVRGHREIIDGSPLIAARHQDAPFTEILLCEMEPTSAAALRQRLTGNSRVQVFEGDCNLEIDRLTAAVPPNRLNLANTKNAPLYHLVLVAKHGLAEKIWRNVIRTEGSGQKRLW